MGTVGRAPASSSQVCIIAKLFKPIYQRKTKDYRDILEILFLNLLGKTTLGHNPQNPLKIPAIWCVIVAAHSVEARQDLLKVV